MTEYAILLDTRFCTGCNTCFYKCVQENRLHSVAENGNARTTVYIRDEGLYHNRCMHCKEPSCVAVCPAGALSESSTGAVLYDSELCIGCKTCISACPFHVPHWDDGQKVIVKCSMCAHRPVTEGKTPACVEVCPTSALEYGEYGAVAAKAKKLAEENKLHLYGLEENGGTHLLVLTVEDPVAIGYPKVPKNTVHSRKAKTIGGTVVGAAAVAALAYTGIKKYGERRSEVAKSGDKTGSEE